MTWADFYLICFVVGFAFSFLSFVGGALRWHLHLPHLHTHVGGPHLPNAPGHAHAGNGSVSPFNFVTITAFLAWFGGTGYLLTRYSGIWLVAGLVLSVASGLVGGTIIFLFLSRVLISKSDYLDPADFEMVGVLGTICSPIREGGTGELIYSQAGTRRTCGARSEQGTAIAKGTEVVVTRYDRGIAYVRPWEQMAGEEEAVAQAK